jgi:hypothetical protein
LIKHITVAAVSALAVGAAQAQLLYSNGPAVDGAGLSILQNPPNTTLGLGIQIGSGNAAADDFVVGGPGWNVSSLAFFSYQTGATSFTFTSANWSVVAGDVNSGTVVASGTAAAVTNGGLMGYRVSTTTLTNTQRPIFRVAVDVPDFTLAPGSYWLRWSLSGSLASGPWQPPRSDDAPGNLHQALTGGAFAPWVDTGSLVSYDAPFEVYGAPVPEPGTYALMLAGLAAVGAVARRRARGARR